MFKIDKSIYESKKRKIYYILDYFFINSILCENKENKKFLVKFYVLLQIIYGWL